MSPTATTTANGNGTKTPSVLVMPKGVAIGKTQGPPQFNDLYEAREYLKGRLAAAFRIFAKWGFDEGVAGHITLRVSISLP